MDDGGAELAAVRCPGFTPDAVVARTGKSLLVIGTFAGQWAVAKLLTDPAPLWRDRFTAEIATFGVFAEHPPPVGAPRLLVGDPDAGLLVLSQVDGRPVAVDRHPTAPLPTQIRDLVVAAVDAMAGWTPPAGAFQPVFDYAGAFHHYGPGGLQVLTDTDVACLAALHAEIAGDGASWVFAHGDAILPNIFFDAGTLTFLDWEWAGLYLAGYDHALLWTVLGADLATRTRLQAAACAADRRATVGFWVNAAVAVSREIHMYREIPPSSEAAHRLAALDADLDVVRANLADLAY